MSQRWIDYNRVMKRLKSLVKQGWFLFILGIILSALVIIGIRFLTYNPVQVHFHANFAVYINGQREPFKAAAYYQAEAVCKTTNDISLPEQRAHMHDNINSVIHVHDHAATWGQFFENLGWYIGPDFIKTSDGTSYVANDSAKLNILLNGQDYTDLTAITNVVIKDLDRLLVSYGPNDQALLKTQFASVPATAHINDITKDPASCSGAENITISDRLHHLF